ncbi:MAG: hypothetical protein AB7O62_08670 [Pirellulales bacterium]
MDTIAGLAHLNTALDQLVVNHESHGFENVMQEVDHIASRAKGLTEKKFPALLSFLRGLEERRVVVAIKQRVAGTTVQHCYHRLQNLGVDAPWQRIIIGKMVLEYLLVDGAVDAAKTIAEKLVELKSGQPGQASKLRAELAAVFAERGVAWP